MNTAKWMCDGTRLVVTHIGDNIVEGRILTGRLAGELRFITRIQTQPPNGTSELAT
ncbi:hypothetical protein IMZ48_32510 [Candidatus Bathyarchaeota archaeon]|nr:hypothetical protein [Candidatus Bathyarchaeota archaeon]